ncbi:hypothetical protein J7I91_21635 [Pseudomonas sp. ISL-84]|nr:hypothetical protein [Pseudomonas sp. ISL-84]
MKFNKRDITKVIKSAAEKSSRGESRESSSHSQLQIDAINSCLSNIEEELEASIHLPA